jgi:hypothetical protein
MVPRERQSTQAILEALVEMLRAIVFVTAMAGISVGEMRQPVFLARQADDALQRQGDPGFLVRLHLGHVDDDVGVEDGIGNAVLVAASTVMRDRCVAVTAVKGELSIGDRAAGEKRTLPHVDDAVAERIPR